MNKTAFVFPGQGSQSVGMGKDLCDASAAAKDLYKIADDIMGVSLSGISFNGPQEELKQTNITQPALFVHSFVLTQLLGDKLKADCTAGHSLGEYTSYAYSRAMDFEQGLKLVKTRGSLMKRSGEIQPGSMAALIGLSEEQVAAVCKEAETSGIVQPANFNCPGQIVISGDVAAIDKAVEIAKGEPYKCRLAKKLEVSGAFHSELMKTSDSELRTALQNTDIKDALIPVYTNADTMPITGRDEIRDVLSRQLVSPVRWEALIRNMIKDGVTKFYEIGSGKVLTGLIKKIEPNAETFNISTYEDIKNLQESV
jgi:[acyl-carrier-protein] S-malonyltransferase